MVGLPEDNCPMQKRAMVFVTTLVLSAAGCLSGAGVRPYRLYPPAPQPFGPEQVSTLTGYVQFVDDKDVSELGGSFELLPGCHVIGTPSHWSENTPGVNSAVVATTGRGTFALPMRAGHRYRIEVIVVGVMTGPTALLTIKGFESDLGGNETREFEQATSPKDIEACKGESSPPLRAPQ
jgi:hypothetical protein